MTPLVEYVTKNGYANIGTELGINAFEHPTLPLVGFKYSQIDSPKTNPVVRWSRGTVLEKDTWNVVAQPFTRFFNYGENLEELKSFDWSSLTVTTKEDGSLCIVYFYAGEWHVNTSGSFGLLKYDAWHNETWRSLFWRTFGSNGGDASLLNPFRTYVFELCTMENKVIRMYPKGRVFLLSVFEGIGELPWMVSRSEAARIGVSSADTHDFSSIEQVETFLGTKEKEDASFEGVVIRDKANIRFKVKSKAYLALHHLHDNGNVSRTDRLVELALANEGDEVLAYLPELKDKYLEIKGQLAEKYADLDRVWSSAAGIEDQKTFALKVKDHQFSGIFFRMRKLPPAERTEKALLRLWAESGELIVKRWPRP